MTEAYRSFADLAAVQREGIDFEIEVQERSTGVLFMAPHGGGIEPGTAPLVKELAGETHSYYCFKGIKKRRGNWCLHITSTRFDEPCALEMLARADQVITVHGASETGGEWVMVGGRDRQLVGSVSTSLDQAGVELRPSDHRSACSIDNICNKGRTIAGVQLELSRALRDRFRNNPAMRRRFVSAVRDALAVGAGG